MKPQTWVLRKLFALVDEGLRKRLGSSPFSFRSTLKQDFFWQGCEITVYILSILFLTMWQWVSSQQGLRFRLGVFPLLFRSVFRCRVWRFAPLLLHWPLGTERDKIQVIQGEWAQFGRTWSSKVVDGEPATIKQTLVPILCLELIPVQKVSVFMEHPLYSIFQIKIFPPYLLFIMVWVITVFTTKCIPSPLHISTSIHRIWKWIWKWPHSLILSFHLPNFVG